MGEKIKKIRLDFGYSQGKLAEILSISRQTLAQIENDERELKANELNTLSKHFAVGAEYFFLENKKPSCTKNINLKKTENLLLYITEQCGAKPNVGETVINKLFYFIEYRFFSKYKKFITGVDFRKMPFGPVPCELQQVATKMIEEQKLKKIIVPVIDYPQKKYLPLVEPDVSVFSKEEKEVIDDIIKKYSHLNARQISNLSHEEITWLRTPDGEIIKFEDYVE